MAKPAKLGYLFVSIILFMGLILGTGCLNVPNVNFAAAIGGPVNATTGAVDAPDPPPGVREVVAEVSPSVVAVDTEELAGSGWILTTDGLIVTNNHVIEGAGAVTITLAGGQTYTGKTIWTDAIDDLAVVDIGVTGLPAARVGDSSKMSVGDWVVAIGNAQGEGISATQGTICCTDSCFRVGTQETLYHTLEITAPITYGNSGGPLLNMDGEVIGIVTGGELTRNGTQVAGYAISSNAAQQIIRDFIENGYVTRAWLGVNVSSVTDLALTGWQPPVENGAFVIKVEADSPAGQAGLAAGDVILNFGGREMNSADDLVEAVRDTEIGQPVTIAYWRDNNENTVIANLVQTPANYTK